MTVMMTATFDFTTFSPWLSFGEPHPFSKDRLCGIDITSFHNCRPKFEGELHLIHLSM